MFEPKLGKTSYSKCKAYKGASDQFGSNSRSTFNLKSTSIEGACSKILQKKNKAVLLSLKKVDNQLSYDLNPLYVSSKEKLRKQKKILGKLKKSQFSGPFPAIEIKKSVIKIEAKEDERIQAKIEFTVDKKLAKKSQIMKCRCVKVNFV